MPMPVENIRGFMQVTDVNGKTNLNWKVTFDLTEELEENFRLEMQNNMIGMMQQGFEGLEKLANESIN